MHVCVQGVLRISDCAFVSNNCSHQLPSTPSTTATVAGTPPPVLYASGLAGGVMPEDLAIGVLPALRGGGALRLLRATDRPFAARISSARFDGNSCSQGGAILSYRTYMVAEAVNASRNAAVDGCGGWLRQVAVRSAGEAEGDYASLDLYASSLDSNTATEGGGEEILLSSLSCSWRW